MAVTEKGPQAEGHRLTETQTGQGPALRGLGWGGERPGGTKAPLRAQDTVRAPLSPRGGGRQLGSPRRHPRRHPCLRGERPQSSQPGHAWECLAEPVPTLPVGAVSDSTRRGRGRGRVVDRTGSSPLPSEPVEALRPWHTGRQDHAVVQHRLSHTTVQIPSACHQLRALGGVREGQVPR